MEVKGTRSSVRAIRGSSAPAPAVHKPAEDLSPHVTLELALSGGHLGFISAGAFGQPYFWLDRRLAQYLHERFKENPLAPGAVRAGKN